MIVDVNGESNLDLGDTVLEAGDVIVHTAYMLVIQADNEEGTARAGILSVDMRGLKINKTIDFWIEAGNVVLEDDTPEDEDEVVVSGSEEVYSVFRAEPEEEDDAA